MKSILKCLLISVIGLCTSLSIFARNRIITVYLHNCQNSSRMIIVHIFSGNFSQKITSNRNIPINYNWLSQQKNLGQGETIAAQCNDQGKRRCIIKSEDSEFSEVRQDKILYFYHHLKGDRGITEVSTDPHLCGSNYKQATTNHLKA